MKLLLICAGGMSTSILMKKLKTAAEQKGTELEVSAIGAGEFDPKGGYDVILLGPQVSYLQDSITSKAEGIPVGVIAMQDYGLARTDNIFKQIDELLAN